MRPYWAFFRTRFLALLQYRAAAIAGIGTQWLFGFVRVMALWAFYQSAGTAQPMAFEQAAAYTWLGQAMLGMLPWNIEREIGESVRTGSVAYELSRPLDLVAAIHRRILYALAQIADFVHAVVGGRVDLHNVHVVALAAGLARATSPAALGMQATEHAGERLGRAGFARAAAAAEQVSVRNAPSF